ncbi:MAG TPA: amino acid racemase [Chloroflexia bacterium]|nr:amino acid racemase [Chloroflexia bacterium]
MKTIGVLGGISPQATMDFEARLHAVAQQLIPQEGNRGYPPLVVYYHRNAPVVIDEHSLPLFPIQPDPAFLDAARRLGTWADFLVITANAPHLLQPAIEEAAGKPVLSMVTLVLDAVRQRGWTRVGLLGLGEPRVYQQPLEALGLAYEILPAAERAPLDQAIIALMEGRADAGTQAVARTAVASLRTRGVDGVVLGCTEIPLLLQDDAQAPDLINPIGLLAEAAVRRALAD